MEPLRTRILEGVAYSLTPPQWLRGPAVIDGDHVVLEDRQRELYQPHVHADQMLFDLIAVHEPNDVLRFVRRYGLLQHGPDATDHREPLEDWRIAVGFLLQTVKLYLDLMAYGNGDASRYDALRENELVRSHSSDRVSPVLRDELERLASGAVAHAITAGLGGGDSKSNVRIRIVAATESEGGGEPGIFQYFFEPPDLLGHAFAEVAHLAVQRAPLAQCPECGRFFAVEHGRQQFCTPACACRARYKRFAAKHREQEGVD
jgi:hypothetical protein